MSFIYGLYDHLFLYFFCANPSHIAPGFFPIRDAPRQVEVLFFNHVADLSAMDKFLLLKILKICYVYICDLRRYILLHIGFMLFLESRRPVIRGENRGYLLRKKLRLLHVYLASKVSIQH